MVREGMLRSGEPATTAASDPFADIWPSHLRRPTYVARSRPRARPRSRASTPDLARVFDFTNRTATPASVATPTWLSEWANPVAVLATPAQIRDAIEELDFSSIQEPLNDRCPISQQPFSPDSRVARLRRCGHICEAAALRRWFTYSVRCPMCRIDIREEGARTPPSPVMSGGPRDNSTSLGGPSIAQSPNPPPPPPRAPPPGAPLPVPPPPPLALTPSTGHSTELAGFATRIASELASQLLGGSDLGNLTVEYTLATQPPIPESGDGDGVPHPATGADGTSEA